MPFVSNGDVLLHYRVEGRPGAPVVALANSLGTTAEIWSDIARPLAERYRILTYDKRGHGLSDAPEADYSLDNHIDDLERLLDHVGAERLVLGGVSVGGLIAQGFVLRHPGRLAGLLLCDTAAQIGTTAFWNERITLLRAGGMGSLADAVMERWFSQEFRRSHKDALRGWRNMLLRIPPQGYAGTCATLRDTDLREQIGRIGVPTLVVVGEQDVATPPDLVRSSAEAIPGARFEVIPGAGHIPSIEQPEALLRLMQSFLGEIGHG